MEVLDRSWRGGGETGNMGFITFTNDHHLIKVGNKKVLAGPRPHPNFMCIIKNRLHGIDIFNCRYIEKPFSHFQL